MCKFSLYNYQKMKFLYNLLGFENNTIDNKNDIMKENGMIMQLVVYFAPLFCKLNNYLVSKGGFFMRNAKRGFAVFLAVCIVTNLISYCPKGNIAMANDVTSVLGTENYTNWSFSTVGYADGTYSYVEPTVADEQIALKDSMFNGYVNFSSVNSSPRVTQSWEGASLCIGIDSDNSIWTSKFVKFALVTANGNTYLSCGVDAENQWIFRDQVVQPDEDIFLQVAFGYADKGSDGEKNDLQIEIWVNGTQMTTVQKGFDEFEFVTSDDVYVTDYVETGNPVNAYVMLHGGQDGTGAVTGTVSIRSVHINPIEKGYEAWTFSNVGHQNGTYSYKAPVVEEEQIELQHSVFEGFIKFSSACGSALLSQNIGMANICIGIDSSNDIWTSRYIKFALVTANGNTYLSCGVDANNQWIFRDKIITPGQEILLRVAFDYIDSDSDGAEDDLKLQVWINGTLATTVQQGYGNYEIVTSDDICVADYVQANNPIKSYVMLHGGQDGEGTVTGNVSIRSSNLFYETEEYIDWTFATAGIDDGSSSYCEATAMLNDQPLTLDATKFSGYVNFSRASSGANISNNDLTGAYVFIGKQQSAEIWSSPYIKFGLVTFNETTYLACGLKGAEQWIFTEKSIAPGEEIFLQVTFDYVAKDGVQRNDLQLHVSINGVEVTRALEAWGNWVNVVSGDDICAFNCVDDRSTMLAHIMLYANEEVSGTVGSVTVRSTMAGHEIHQKELTYDLADGEEGYILLGKGTFYVDGVQATVGTNLKDAGDYEITRVYNGKTYVRTIHIVDSRSNAVQVPAVTYDALGGDEVMPLLGWYLPYSRLYEKADGQTGETVFTADKYYQLTKESGINIIGYTETNATNMAAVREQLRLAEKYNMGMYVQDETLWTLDESEYWNRISEYSDYESFLGAFLIDEPGTDGYAMANDTRGDAYKNPSRVINKYANLTGYINLLPMFTRLAKESKNLYVLYGEYIDETAIDADAKMISFDRYPSDGASNDPDWRLDEEGNYILTNSYHFYRNLSIIRDKAKTHNLPFWTFVETGDYSDAEDYGLKAENGKYRQIEGEEILWYVNTALAYGTKAIEYYSLAEVDTTTDVGADGAAEHGLFDCQGNKTKWYGYVQKANKQIAAVDHVLMKSDNLGVMTAGTNSYITNNIKELPEYLSTASSSNLKSLSAEDATYGALAGVFCYYPDEASGIGYNAYYVVNNNPAERQNITLNFNNATTYSVIQDAKTTYVGTAGTTCQLKIPAGEGVLIVAGMDLTKTVNDTQVVYFEDIEPYRINDVTGEKEYRAPEFKQAKTYTDWTFSTADVASGSHGYKEAEAHKNNKAVPLDGSRFNGYVQFSSACGNALLSQNWGMANLCIGASGANIWGSKFVKFALVTANGNTYLACGTGNNEQWILRDQIIQPNERFLLQATFDYVDKDNDGAEDDLQLQVWINGVQATTVQQAYGNYDMVTSDDLYVLDYVADTPTVTAYVMLHGGQDSNGAVIGTTTVGSVDVAKETKDYVFAGWYTDEACTTPLAKDVTSGAAYAKFVDADVLSVKIQLNAEHTAIRFVSTVDTLAYSQVGYDIRCKETEKVTGSSEVYEHLYGVSNQEIMEYSPTVCSKFSKYFYTYTISEIPTDEASQKVPFIVNSYWITLDGTKVLGDTISYSMQEAIQAEKEVEGI